MSVFDDAKLFQPTRIAGVNIKNRIAMAPMSIGGLVTEDGCLSKRARDFYVERAKGGVGLIITGVTKVENEIEKFIPGIYPNISVHPARFVEKAAELIERVHAYNTKIFLQLAIGYGRVAPPTLLKEGPVAPSAIPNYWAPSVTCKEVTTKEVERLVTKAGESAEIALEVGFDGVEIHAMHEGYLIDQFAIKKFNRRSDKYGGDLRGRLTFPIEIVKEIKQRTNEDFPVQLRYSIKSYIKDLGQGALPEEEFKEKGRRLEEGLEVARILEDAGYDSFNADAGSYEAWYWAHPPAYQKHGCYLHLTKQLKKVVNAPVIVAGRMGLPALAEEVLEQGKAADIIALGRALLADPHWPRKIKAGEERKIRPCIGCHNGCLGRIFETKPLSCAVNAACGREQEYSIQPAQEPKDIMVIGGGVAGMEAARVSAIRGHNVTLFEKREKLGGHVMDTASMEFKKDGGRLVDWYETTLYELDVEITLNKEATPELVKENAPNEVLVATGSVPALPDIPGIERQTVTTVIDLLRGNSKPGDELVIIGGGLVGCEAALWLARQDRKITIIEERDELMHAGTPVPYANREMLLDLLNFEKIEILTNHYLKKISQKEVVLINRHLQEKVLPINSVIIATGLEPNQELYHKLENSIVNLHLIGDAREPRNVMGAIWDAYEVARNL